MAKHLNVWVYACILLQQLNLHLKDKGKIRNQG